MTEIHLHGITPVVLNPGDRVLIALDRSDLAPAELHELKDRLAERLPDVEITLVAGVESVTVQRVEGEQQ